MPDGTEQRRLERRGKSAAWISARVQDWVLLLVLVLLPSGPAIAVAFPPLLGEEDPVEDVADELLIGKHSRN